MTMAMVRNSKAKDSLTILLRLCIPLWEMEKARRRRMGFFLDMNALPPRSVGVGRWGSQDRC